MVAVVEAIMVDKVEQEEVEMVEQVEMVDQVEMVVNLGGWVAFQVIQIITMELAMYHHNLQPLINLRTSSLHIIMLNTVITVHKEWALLKYKHQKYSKDWVELHLIVNNHRTKLRQEHQQE